MDDLNFDLEELNEFIVDALDAGDFYQENRDPKTKRKRSTKINHNQIEKLIKFDANNSSSAGFVNKTKSWENLMSELNLLGPPSHTVDEWKRVLSQYKTNSKKKKATQESNGEIHIKFVIVFILTSRLQCKSIHHKVRFPKTMLNVPKRNS